MKNIIIGFSRPKSKLAIIAHMIRLFEGKTPYSHVYLKWYSESLNRYLIYEARGNGVNFTNIKSFEEHNVIVYESSLIVNKEEKQDIMQFCIDNARTNYGYSQVLGIGLVKLLKKVGITIKNPFTSGNVCSEIAAKILTMLNIEVKEDLNLIGPRYIFEVLNGPSQNNPQ